MPCVSFQPTIEPSHYCPSQEKSSDFCRMVLTRIQETIDSHLTEEQCGFRSARGTTDATFTVRQLFEKSKERLTPIHWNFVDFINLAAWAFGRLRDKIWSNQNISRTIKVRIYKALILPIATYGSESWTLRKIDKNKLEVFEMRCLRTIAGVKLCDRVRNVNIR